jgi:transforming growth factor-beta-induced protein
VLNPANTTATPNPAATTQAIMFTGAAAASNVPFTSGISATTTAPSATTQTAAARLAIDKPVVGVVGAAALFGMVVAGL